MTKKLYEEALADVKKLKEVAEDNAKRALLEAVTPRIRYLIENQLLGETGIDELEADPEKLLMDEFPESTSEESFESVPMSPVTATGDSSFAASAISMPDEEGKVTLDLDKLNTDDEEYDLSDDEYVLSKESVKHLGMLSNSTPNNLVHKINNIQKQVKLFAATGRFVRESKGFSSALSTLISEVEDTYSYLQTNLQDSPKKSSYETILENNYSTLRQLMEQKMKKRLSTLSEADVTLKLTNMPDDLEVEDLGVEIITGEEGEEGEGEDSGSDDENFDLDLDSEEGAGEEEGEEEGGSDDLDLDLDTDEDEDENKLESHRLSNNTIVEIDENMLRREIGRMKRLRETTDMPKNAPKGSGVGKVSDNFEDENMGDPFTDVKLSEVDEMMDEDDDLSQSMYEDDNVEQAEDSRNKGGNTAPKSMGPGADTDKQSRGQAATVESIKRHLAAEARLQTEAKKKASKAKGLKAEQQKKAQRAKKMSEKQAAKKNAQKMDEAYAFYATKFNESVARCNKLKGMLTEAIRKGAVLNNASSSSAAETGLRNKLAETNLFNAKLLFTNKLLQNESLTKRQKAEVIERLDEAKNEREVKLVYESLIKTLVGSSSQKLTESTNQSVIGSSSRPSRTASSTNTLNEGFESDRWARLAGIVK